MVIVTHLWGNFYRTVVRVVWVTIAYWLQSETAKSFIGNIVFVFVFVSSGSKKRNMELFLLSASTFFSYHHRELFLISFDSVQTSKTFDITITPYLLSGSCRTAFLDAWGGVTDTMITSLALSFSLLDGCFLFRRYCYLLWCQFIEDLITIIDYLFSLISTN